MTWKCLKDCSRSRTRRYVEFCRYGEKETDLSDTARDVGVRIYWTILMCISLILLNNKQTNHFTIKKYYYIIYKIILWLERTYKKRKNNNLRNIRSGKKSGVSGLIIPPEEPQSLEGDVLSVKPAAR
jgi:hypothetical protein